MLELNDVSVTYVSGDRQTHALEATSLTVKPNEFVSILGPSGCGKSTLLYSIVGLQEPNTGTVAFDGEVGAAASASAVVFQDATLLPWRTVRGNVEYGMEIRGVPKKERQEIASELITLVGLDGFETFFPRQLSGGMQQRVNVARALALKPRVLLLDEPFAALDAMTREQMQSELLRIWSETRVTAIFITHQVDEAIYLSDRVLVMSARPGRIVADISVDLPRPRQLEIKQTREFVEYEREVIGYLHGRSGAE